MATLARGGRLNVFGFVLRLARDGAVPVHRRADLWPGRARPLRLCGADGRVRRAARCARPAARPCPAARQCQEAAVVHRRRCDAGGGDRLGDRHGDPVRLPQGDVPDDRRRTGMDRLLAITVLAIAWTDIALAALAYHHDVASTVRARSIVQPWMITIVAFGWSYISLDDGLIVAYVCLDGRGADCGADPAGRAATACRTAGSPICRSPGEPRCATCRWPPPTRSNGRRGASTSRFSAHSCRRASSASIMSRSRSRRCRPSSRPASSPCSARRSRARSPPATAPRSPSRCAR